jgi:hypothetical protein
MTDDTANHTIETETEEMSEAEMRQQADVLTTEDVPALGGDDS